MTKTIRNNELISTLWIVVLFTMIYADILTFITPGIMKQIVDGTMDVNITEPLLLFFAVLLQLPVIMILLSRILKRKINRILNITVSVITIVFIIGGGSNYMHYYFFAAVEILCMITIIFISVNWKKA